MHVLVKDLGGERLTVEEIWLLKRAFHPKRYVVEVVSSFKSFIDAILAQKEQVDLIPSLFTNLLKTFKVFLRTRLYINMSIIIADAQLQIGFFKMNVRHAQNTKIISDSIRD